MNTNRLGPPVSHEGWLLRLPGCPRALPLRRRLHRHPAPDGEINESTDTSDTLDWLLATSGHNGKAGICGISYSGFFAGAL